MSIKDIENKNIHIIGVSGSEGSAVLFFLAKHNISSISCHDFISYDELEKNFKRWHKGIGKKDKEKYWEKFSAIINSYKCYFGKDYLKDIENADIIFIPQSWRLYNHNQPLLKISG